MTRPVVTFPVVRVCLGGLAGFIVGATLGYAVDPATKDFNHVGATLVGLFVGAWVGMTVGSYLSAPARDRAARIKIAIGVLVLLPFTELCAVLTALPLYHVIPGVVGGILAVLLSVIWLTAPAAAAALTFGRDPPIRTP